MKKLPQPKPEANNKPSITLPSRTRTPIEAFQMLRLGHPVDVMAGYYDDQDLLDKDFWMMDKVAKLHHIADLRKLEGDLKRNEQMLHQEIKDHQTQLQNEKESIAKAAAQNSGQNNQVTQGATAPLG